MKIKRTLRTLVILAILSSNIGCDQVSKHIIRQQMDDHEIISLITHHLTLIKVENTGAFLSLGHSWPKPLKMVLLILFPVFALTLGLIYVLANRNLTHLTVTGICFVLGGGVGNIYDRVIHGSVTDFLHVDVGLFQTGIFNMADVSVMTGALIVLIDSYVEHRKLNGVQ